MIKKILIALVLIPLIIVGISVCYVKYALPNVGEIPQLNIEPNAEMLVRGEYLFNYGAACVACHSNRDVNRFSHPMVEGTEGMGGQAFDQPKGFPGAYYAANITPAGVGDWTDEELYRAITCGVSKDGRALFPIMPYPNYAQMDMKDIKAIIAYVRTLEPIEHATKTSVSDFPMSLIINTMPKPAEHNERPDKSDKIAYGKYVATMASCGDCHTPIDDKGQPLPGMSFAGGMVFPQTSGGISRSANITPDEKTGIGSWNRDLFIQRFKAYADSSYVPHEVREGTFNSEMPWTNYAYMDEGDLSAIYDYLQTLEAVEHSVEKFSN